MGSPEINVVLSTVPDHETGLKLAHELVSAHLAACVNIVPVTASVYEWEGKIHSESECLLIIKTSADKTDSLKGELARIHPYDVPEIIVLQVLDGNREYLDWVKKCTS